MCSAHYIQGKLANNTGALIMRHEVGKEEAYVLLYNHFLYKCLCSKVVYVFLGKDSTIQKENNIALKVKTAKQ